jgi:hypothetical protein
MKCLYVCNITVTLVKSIAFHERHYLQEVLWFKCLLCYQHVRYMLVNILCNGTAQIAIIWLRIRLRAMNWHGLRRLSRPISKHSGETVRATGAPAEIRIQ